MIFVYLDLLDIDVFAAFVLFGALVTALIAGISFHEFSHAFVADSMGDRLPRSLGRVTLNPLAHLAPDGRRLIPAFLPDEAARPDSQFQARCCFLNLIALIALPFLPGGQFGILFE